MKKVIYLLAVLGIANAIPNYWEDKTFKSEESSENGQSPGSKSTNCSCGWTNKGRIVGGRETLVNEYPLIGGLVDKEKDLLFCGSAIITKYHALTASHCTVPYKNKKIYFGVSLHDLTKVDVKTSTSLYLVKNTIEHEKYNEMTLANDIALLVLEKELEFSKTVGPACLPNKLLDLVNQQVKVLGWGHTTHAGKQSDVLLKVNLKVISTEQCYETYPIDLGAPDVKHVMCTYRHEKDSCNGDSGGPVVWLDPETNRYTLVGLVSHGKICGETAAINANVGYFLPWIHEKIASTKLDVQICSKKE